MAWTTPKTWLVGEQVTAAQLNAQIRDNLNFLGTTHDHGTSAGEGSAQINPTQVNIGTTIGGIGARDIARGQSSATELTFARTAPVQVQFTAQDPDGTIGIWTLGAGGTQMAAGDHSH